MFSLNELAIFKQSRFFKYVQTRIESTSNSKIKHLVRMRKSSHYRKEVGSFLLEGKREIGALLAGGHSLEELYFLENSQDEELKNFISSITEKGIPSLEVAEGPMRKISYRGEASKVIGVAKTWDLNLRILRNESLDAVLILDEIEKPGNLGAILRTAEAMGVKAVLLSDTSVDFFNPNVIRSSMGLFATQPVFCGTKKEILEWARKAELLVVGTSSNAKQTIYEYDFQSRTALLMGSESTGLGQFWEKNVDAMVSIPMKGHGSSLNLNCATAGILMEINRRKFNSKT
jgi:TrmH family RNA methyltransferase